MMQIKQYDYTVYCYYLKTTYITTRNINNSFRIEGLISNPTSTATNVTIETELEILSASNVA